MVVTRMIARVAAASLAASTTVLVLAGPARAADFAPAPGTYVVDTSAATITGPGVAIVGSIDAGAATFTFDNVSLVNGVLVRATGSLPLRLVVRGTLAVAGTISADGGSATNFTNAVTPGGPGGGAGGQGAGSAPGPGGGSSPATNVQNGGGGGGFGGAGVGGGVQVPPEAGGTGGAVYGNLLTTLQGGSGGGASHPSSATSGGGGGGAIDLVATTITVTPTGVIRTDGGDGAVGGHGASGGGSGGALRLRTRQLVVSGSLAARGGDGGEGGCCGGGGGGGGGRIALYYRTATLTGTISAAGGQSNRADSSNSVTPGPYGPTAAGGPGVVSLLPASTLKAPPATTVSYGRSLRLSTRLTESGTGSGVAGAAVSLYRRSPSSAVWQRVRTTTTSGNGTAGVAVAQSASALYQWRYAGSANRQAATSGTASVRVAATVSLRVRDATVAKGATIRLSGASRPARTTSVRLQLKKGARWVTVSSVKARKGRYVFARKVRTPGTAAFRVVRPAAGGLATGTSRTVKVRVR